MESMAARKSMAGPNRNNLVQRHQRYESCVVLHFAGYAVCLTGKSEADRRSNFVCRPSKLVDLGYYGAEYWLLVV